MVSLVQRSNDAISECDVHVWKFGKNVNLEHKKDFLSFTKRENQIINQDLTY